MQYFIESFSTREIAVFIWFTLFLATLFSLSGVRESLGDVLRLLFTKVIMIPLICLFIYILIVLFMLFKLNLWEIDLLKDTILWFSTTAILLLFRISKAEGSVFFKNMIKDNIQLSVVVEFILNFYTYDLWFELIIVPLFTMLFILTSYSEIHTKYAQIHKILKNVLSCLGLVLFIVAFYKTIVTYQDLLNINNLFSFALPIFLTVAIIPYLYALLLYINYENSFIRFRCVPEYLHNYAKTKAFLRFNVNTDGLKRWTERLFMIDIKSKNDINTSINYILNLQKIEKKPPYIKPEKGWSPYQAKDFLLLNNVKTGYYKHCFEEEWQASSPYIKLDNEISSNTVAYYVCGNESVANSLKLVLNVNNPPKQVFEKDLLIHAKSLYSHALNKTIPSIVEMAIMYKNEIVLEEPPYKIIVSKMDWPNDKGYSLTFEIQHHG